MATMASQKVTSELSPSQPGCHGKWYGDACGTAFAMELIGERWSLMIIRELMLGARRFSDIRSSLPGLSAKVLTERLASLEDAGIINREKLPPPAAVQVYGLTPWGYAGEPAIQELGRWAAKHRGHDPRLPLSAVSLMLSMRTMLLRTKAGATCARIGFDIAGEQFLATLEGGELSIRRGDAALGEAIFRMPDAAMFARLLYAHVPATDLEREGFIIEGDRDLALRYAALFALPEKLT